MVRRVVYRPEALPNMPTRIEWYTEDDTCLLLELTAPLSWDEFHSGAQEAHTAIRGVRPRVTLLVHTLAPLPPGSPLAHFRRAFNDQPPNVEQVIIVYEGANPMLRFMQSMGAIIRAIFPNKSKLLMVKGMSRALALLHLPEPRAS
jgi:hypothetical protein